MPFTVTVHSPFTMLLNYAHTHRGTDPMLYTISVRSHQRRTGVGIPKSDSERDRASETPSMLASYDLFSQRRTSAFSNQPSLSFGNYTSSSYFKFLIFFSFLLHRFYYVVFNVVVLLYAYEYAFVYSRGKCVRVC